MRYLPPPLCCSRLASSLLDLRGLGLPAAWALRLIARYAKTCRLCWVLCAAIGLMVGCSSQPQQWSQAAAEQKTATGVRIAPEIGVPTTPSVEYIRVRMTDTLFLDPPLSDHPQVYLNIRNTSGRDALGLHHKIAQQLEQKGYRLLSNAKQADYIVQGNILFADEVSAAELAQLDETTFGNDLAEIIVDIGIGAGVGAAVGAATGGGKGAAIGGAAGAVIGGVASVIQDHSRKQRLRAKQSIRYFSIVVDIQLREQIKGNGVVRIAGNSAQSTRQTAGSGAIRENSAYSQQQTQTYSETSNWKRYQTRVIGKAKGKLVAFEDVEQNFINQLASSVTGLL